MYGQAERLSRQSAEPSNSGLTLIELLISLSIVAVVMSLVSASLAILTRVAAEQGARHREHATTAALQAIAKDIERSAPISGDDGHIFEVGINIEAGSEFSELTMATVRRDIDVGPYSCFTIELRQYYLALASDGSYEMHLRRRPLGGPGSEGPGTVSILATGLADFQVSAYAGGEMNSTWSASDQSPLPEAVKLSITHSSSSRESSVLVYLPSGNTIISNRETALSE